MKIPQPQSVFLSCNLTLASGSPIHIEASATAKPQNTPSEGRSVFEEEAYTQRPRINPAQSTSSRPCGRMWLGRPIQPVRSHPLQQFFTILHIPKEYDASLAAPLIANYISVFLGKSSGGTLSPIDLKTLADHAELFFANMKFSSDFDPAEALLILKAYEDLRIISTQTTPFYTIDHNSLRLLVRDLSRKYHPESTAPGAAPKEATFIRIRQAWSLIDDFKNPPNLTL